MEIAVRFIVENLLPSMLTIQAEVPTKGKTLLVPPHPAQGSIPIKALLVSSF
jgi:hypothetical protein